MAKDRQSQNKPSQPALPPGVKLLRTLKGHERTVFSVSFDSSGRTLASGAIDTRVILWDTVSGKILRTLEKHRSYVCSVSFDPSGRTLASAGNDHRVILWDVASGKILRTLTIGHDRVFSLSFDPSGRTLAGSSGKNRVILWDVASGEILRTLTIHHGYVSHVSFDPSGRTLAGGTDDDRVVLWDMASGEILRTLPIHHGRVFSVSFDPSRRTLAGGSDDGTVTLWDAASGRLLRTLEGHTGRIDWIEFSCDGRLLGSKSVDGTIRLWRCDTWELATVIPERASDYLISCLSFHPKLPLLASAGLAAGAPGNERSGLVHLWELDLDVLLGKTRKAERQGQSVGYTVAKVVLVGDTGVGKSGLAQRLVQGRFVPTESSHARRAYLLEDSTVATPQGAKVHRETVLWDLAGQPAYRLVHQFSIEDAALACVLFDARSESNPLEDAAYWSQVLDQAKTNSKLIKLLVASRTDVGGLPASMERIGAFVHEHDFDGFFVTSAKTGDGCDALLEAIRKKIPWDDVPAVTSTQVLAALRTFVARLKGEKGPPVEGEIPALLTVAQLQRLFEADSGHEVPPDDFIAYLQRLEATDTIDLLVFHTTGQIPRPDDKVLLDPTRVDAYASAMLVAAKDEPDGPGHLLESRVRRGDFKLDASERLADKESERHVLWFVMENLLSRDLALHEKIKGDDYVVFPSQCTTELRFPGAGAFGVAFSLAGLVRSIYATLIAQLAHFEGFKRKEFFQDAAAYQADAGGRCFVRLRDLGRGRGELEVSFDGDPAPAVRQGFIDFIGRHIEAKSVLNSVTRRYAYFCANGKCRRPFQDDLVRARLEQRKRSLLCPLCEKRTPLVDLLAPVTKAAASIATQIDDNAKVGRQRLTARWVIKAKEEQRKFDVFLSHNSKDKKSVEAIARKLLSVGLRPWLDKWNLAPGDTISDALEQAIKTIPCAALCFGPADVGKWHIMEIRAYEEAWANKEARMIPLILPGIDEPPELPIWVRQTLWVDMRDWQEPKSDAFYRLVCGILGRPPGDSPSMRFGVRDVAGWQGWP